MNLRLRWFELALDDLHIRKIADAMIKTQYTRRRAIGFRLEEVRREHLLGHFIERVEWTEEVEDPAGGRVDVHRVELRRVMFRLGREAPELQIFNAPRTLRAFVEGLSECVGSAVALRELLVTPMEWVEELEGIVGHLTVLALTATGLTISPSSSASVTLEGTEDVRRHLARFTGGRPAGIDRVIVSLPAPYGGRGILLPSAKAGVREGDEKVVDVLRQSLIAAQRRRSSVTQAPAGR